MRESSFSNVHAEREENVARISLVIRTIIVVIIHTRLTSRCGSALSLANGLRAILRYIQALLSKVTNEGGHTRT